MRPSLRVACLLCVVPVLAFAVPASAVSPVPVTFGSSWDGAANDLQHIVDARYGPGKITVTTDYIGAHAGDPDPWFWDDSQFSAFLVTEVAGNANQNVVGWYLDTGGKPATPPNATTLYNDNVHDAVVFNGPASAGASAVVTFSGGHQRFGFYMNPNGPAGATNAPEPELFFTNRFYNDIGRDGSGAIHPPTDGDVQALVFNISAIVGHPNTWLVCFEDLDSGGAVGTETDNDYNDFVFEITALGTTPARHLTHGDLRRLYR